VNHYNHFRPHQGLKGMVPADRFFDVEDQIREELNRQREIVRLEWLEQGKPGWRPVKASLPEIGTRLIQKVMSELKENDRKKVWKAKRNIKRLKVNYKNIV